MTATVDQESLRRLTKCLERFDPAVRKRIAKDALRPWGKVVRQAARRFAWKNAERTKKQLTVKVKTYKRAVWAGVGVKTEKVKTPPSERLGRYSPFVGWKSHFMEVGWHAWPRGTKGNAERVKEIQRNLRIDAGEGGVREITVYRNGKAHTRRIRERKRTLSEGGSAGGGRGWRRGIRGRMGTFQSQYARHYLYKAGMVGKQAIRGFMNKALGAAIVDARKAGTA